MDDDTKVRLLIVRAVLYSQVNVCKGMMPTIRIMSYVKLFKTLLSALLLVFGISHSLVVMAGFLDMPEITETPMLRGKTMVQDLDIPDVRDRNPDPESGPRLAIKEFRIQGLVEYPELGITRAAINNMVDQIRRDLMKDDKILPLGYTQEEIGEVTDLLVDIEEESINRHVTTIELQRLVWLVREQRAKRGIHLGQIEAIADQITTFYRDRGFILAKAFIPKQEVRGGVVSLTLLLGVLGEVKVKNNQLYSTSAIHDVFDDVLTHPVTGDKVEERLFLINDYPGLTVDGYFESGYQVGDSKLNINVKQEDRFNSNVRIDNHGTEDAGLYRTYADIQINNPLGLADQLHLSTLVTTSPANTTYWRVRYETKLFSPRLKGLVSSSSNQYVVDKSLASSSLKIEGEVRQNKVASRYIFKRSRISNYNIELAYEEITSDLSINFLDEKVSNTILSFNFDKLNEKSKILHQGSIKFTKGEYEQQQVGRNSNEYNVYNLDYTFLTFAKVPFFDANSRLIIRSNAQYSDETNLSSIVRFQLGGPTRARAYSPNLFSADDAFYLGIDWVFNSPGFMDVTVFDSLNLKEFIKPFVFLDVAYGKQQAISEVATAKSVDANVSNWGIGLQFSQGVKFSGNLMLAVPIEAHANDDTVMPADPGKRIVFDFQYSF